MKRQLVQVSAGSGPIEVRAFVALLARRMERLCAERGLEVGEVTWVGPEEAPVSVTLRVRGDASSALASEVGTHALLARSPRRGRASRKRWFAAVSVDDDAAPDGGAPHPIQPAEVLVTASRAGGRGGQHVNKVSTAVRVHHPASGVSVRVASERSQRQNLRIALLRISELWTRRREEEDRGYAARLRRARRQVIRGAPVRTYRPSAEGELELL